MRLKGDTSSGFTQLDGGDHRARLKASPRTNLSTVQLVRSYHGNVVPTYLSPLIVENNPDLNLLIYSWYKPQPQRTYTGSVYTKIKLTKLFGYKRHLKMRCLFADFL